LFGIAQPNGLAYKFAMGILMGAREALGKTQSDIAADVDASQATVSDWETGSATPRPSRWRRIAKAYALPLRALADMWTKSGAR
jgi:transcriptional regulator with XRE-family HTH domain